MARHVPSESLLDEDRLSDFPESEASLIAKQARSELLDRVANFCELERGDNLGTEKGQGHETSLLSTWLEPPLIGPLIFRDYGIADGITESDI